MDVLHRLLPRFVAQVACLALAAGCLQTPQGDESGAGLQHQQLSAEAGDTGPLPFDAGRMWSYPDDVVVVGMIFDVERFLVPADKAAAERERIWKYVDELRIDPATTAYLKKNGFRMGVVNGEDIGVLRDLLAGLEARSERMRQTVRSGYPLTLDLGETGSYRTIFTFGPNGDLEGRTFDTATKYLHINYSVQMIRQRPRVKLGVTPEIFQESERPHYQAGDGHVRYEKRYQGIVYHDLAVELSTAPGEVLVIGPADADGNRFILGRTILSGESAGRRWETILCIAPQLYRTRGPKGAP